MTTEKLREIARRRGWRDVRIGQAASWSVPGSGLTPVLTGRSYAVVGAYPSGTYIRVGSEREALLYALTSHRYAGGVGVSDG